MASKKKSVTEPLQDDIIVKAERAKEEKIEKVVKQRVLTTSARKAELSFILDGIAYRKRLAAQAASEKMDAIQKELASVLSSLDAAAKEVSQELETLSTAEDKKDD